MKFLSRIYVIYEAVPKTFPANVLLEVPVLLGILSIQAFLW